MNYLIVVFTHFNSRHSSTLLSEDSSVDDERCLTRTVKMRARDMMTEVRIMNVPGKDERVSL